MAAAERLLSRGRSWNELTVDEADASIGALYHRFRDKDALRHVLQRELCTQGAATAVRAAELAASGAPLSELVRAFVTVAVASYREQRGLRRARLVEMCTNGVFRERAIELSKQTCAGLTAHVTSPDQLATVNDVARGWCTARSIRSCSATIRPRRVARSPMLGSRRS